ncbi:MAG: ATP-binding protein [Anaerolineales bacterium]|nr:MAG: ATP-binding protein [Anaerolineales bacterium]
MIERSELEDILGPRVDETPLGIVVGGSLSSGLQVKIDPRFSMEKLAVGRYVVIRGRQTNRRFFGIVTDIALDATNPDIVRRPPDLSEDFVLEVYGSEVAFGTLNVSLMLMLDEEQAEPRPVKTIPSHFSPTFEASAQDVERVFGEEDETHFYVGTPLDMEQVQVNLDLARFVERSSGVFGKSGTGKSFITRTVLAGIIKSGLAATLIFDMHNDYGWAVKDEIGREFKGLRQLFPDGRVSVVTLDEDTSRARGSKIDRVLKIGYEQIEPEDVEMLSSLLGLSDVQIGALYYLRRTLGPSWIAKLLEIEKADEELQDLIESGRIVAGTLGAIQRKFEFFRRMGFLVPGRGDDTVEDIFLRLSNGTNVVLEFGNYGNTMAAYILVANYLTRRIHGRYVHQKNLASGGKADEPKPLVIVIEEAHKFLDPKIASHTIFGTIARELRKYNVTLLIVDQRPSGIDDEVMSQIGTRVTCLLDNEADIRAVFSGVSGASALREVLARLDTRQQALILGHAVPMPVVVRTRDYDQSFYAAIGVADANSLRDRAKKGSETLFGE